MDIKTNIKPGDKVFWVKERLKLGQGTTIVKNFFVYEATVEEIHLCEYQGALYCTLHCPSFKINPYPTVHYSNVFTTREQANSFREVLKKAEGKNWPMCYGCQYAWHGRGV